MSDYIDRDKAIMAITSIASEVAQNAPYDAEWFDRLAERQVEIISVIMQEPTADVEPVRHGRWIWDDEGYHCSECWYHAQGNTLECMEGTFRFCPICGAKMEVVDDETN